MSKKVNQIKVLKLSEAIALLKELRTTGKTFRIDFIKKSTGRVRTMVCRMGVRKYHVINPKRVMRSRPNDIMTVYEWGNNYRSLCIDNIILIKKGSILYSFHILNNLRASHLPAEIGIFDIPPVQFPAYTSILKPNDNHLAHVELLRN